MKPHKIYGFFLEKQVTDQQGCGMIGWVHENEPAMAAGHSRRIAISMEKGYPASGRTAM